MFLRQREGASGFLSILRYRKDTKKQFFSPYITPHPIPLKMKADGSLLILILRWDQRGDRMLLKILNTITDFAVLVMRLTTEELSDEQRIALIDQFIRPQGLDTAFQFDLHDLLMILITILIIIFWRAWSRANRWPYR